MKPKSLLLVTSLVALSFTSGATGAEKKVVASADVAWKDMTAAQRGLFMKKVVTPKMKVLFQQYDAEEFQKFTCATCHGKDGKQRKFKMPSPDLHSLPGSKEAFEAALAKKPSWPKWTKFMAETVVPEMAALLKQPAFDPAKPVEGAFSCNACHTLDKP